MSEPDFNKALRRADFWSKPAEYITMSKKAGIIAVAKLRIESTMADKHSSLHMTHALMDPQAYINSGCYKMDVEGSGFVPSLIEADIISEEKCGVKGMPHDVVIAMSKRRGIFAEFMSDNSLWSPSRFFKSNGLVVKVC